MGRNKQPEKDRSAKSAKSAKSARLGQERKRKHDKNRILIYKKTMAAADSSTEAVN